MKRLFRTCLLTGVLLSAGCGSSEPPGAKVYHTAVNKLIATLDPALAADTACQHMTAAFYDTPLQYSLRARPFRLEPAMLESMPEISPDGRVLRCRLRKGLVFQKNACFPSDADRRISAKDFIFSILRLADVRVRSTGYWLIRGRIEGLDEFRALTEKAPEGDMTPYDQGCRGLRILDGRTFEIRLSQADPQFLYALAMPYFSVVSRRAAEYYGEKFADNPCGSGPFLLEAWERDHQIRLARNPDYREEYLDGKRLPLCDAIVCSLVKQPMAAWLLFLQGELDSYALDAENFAAVVNRKLELAPALRKRGIELLHAPEFQTNYIGFCFADPLLAKNENLRRAVSLAFDRDRRIRHSSGRFVAAGGPVPPGTAGFLEEPGPYGKFDPELAKEYLRKAGFPDGIDPATGKPLELVFDQAGGETFYLQTAELLSLDLGRIGIRVRPEFNNRARFLQKLGLGQTQLFRLSWTADYPDAENFLQLFYGPNAGASNRTGCSFPEFDRAYEIVRTMPSSPERDAEYVRLAQMVRDRCPWIFESFTVAFILKHEWAGNLEPNDFAFNGWKYVSVDPERRIRVRGRFTPLSMSELRNEPEEEGK